MVSARLLALCGLLLLCASASALSPPRFRSLNRAAAAAHATVSLDLNSKLTSKDVQEIKTDTFGPLTKAAIKVDATFKDIIIALVGDYGTNVGLAKPVIKAITASQSDNNAEADLYNAFVDAAIPQQKQEEQEEKESMCLVSKVKDVSSTIKTSVHFFSNEFQFEDEPNILSAVASAIQAADASILIVSDKFSDSTVQAALVAAMTKKVKVTIITGSEDGAPTLTLCEKQKDHFEKFRKSGEFQSFATDYQFPNDKVLEFLPNTATVKSFFVDLKMHNKFMVIDDKLVLIGSPNYTPPGMGSGTFAAKKFNVEALVVVADQMLAHTYLEYGRLIQLSVGDAMFPHVNSFKDKEQTKKLIQLMEEMNTVKSPIRPCLAPVCNLYHFFRHHIDVKNQHALPTLRKGIKSVIVAQYLIAGAVPWVNKLVPVITKPVLAKIHGEKSPDDYKQWVPEDQGIGYLLAELGDKVTVYWDADTYYPKAQAQIADNVKISNAIIDKGGKLFSVKADRKIFHNKLILIEYGDGTFTTIIGSAGFTYSVQQNMNCENMVAIDGKELYDSVLLHIEAFKKNSKRTVAAIQKKI